MTLAEGRETMFSGLKGFCCWDSWGSAEGRLHCMLRKSRVKMERAQASSYSSRVGENNSEWGGGQAMWHGVVCNILVRTQ